MSTNNGDVTRRLGEFHRRSPDASAELLRVVYRKLRRIAAGCLRAERPNHTLQPTALVHDAYLRLIKQREQPLNDRDHFFRLMRRLMRQILVDHGRQRAAKKRAWLPGPDPAYSDLEDAVALHDALKELGKVNRRQHQVVVLRNIVGLTRAEVSTQLDIAPRTVDRELAAAHAWLYQRLRA